MPEKLIKQNINFKIDDDFDEFIDPTWWTCMKEWIEPFRKLLLLSRKDVNAKRSTIFLDLNFNINHDLIRPMFEETEFKEQNERRAAHDGNFLFSCFCF